MAARSRTVSVSMVAMERLFRGSAVFAGLRRVIARAAIAALIANVALPVIVALSFAAVVPASASPFPICSAHAAIIGDVAPSGPAGKRIPVPLGCPLCPVPMPAEIPSLQLGLPSIWARLPVPPIAVRHISLPESGPSPIWPQAPPVFS